MRFKLGEKIGKGGFGSVYSATDTLTSSDVAAKIEEINGEKNPLLLYEANIYNYLVGLKTVPRVHYSANENNRNVLVLDLLGKSLATQYKENRPLFTKNGVLKLADKMVRNVQHIHQRGVLHRDLKPGNFVFGVGDHQQSLYLIAFGLSKVYINPNTKNHIPYKEGKGWLGTPRYSSINTHLGKEASRRDDLQSIGFITVLLLKGSLPWDSCPPIQNGQKREYLDRILQSKQQSIESGELFRNLPPCIEQYFNVVNNLEFNETPPYRQLRQILRQEIT